MKQWFLENRVFLLRLTGTALAIALIVVLVRDQGTEEIVSALKQISPATLLLGLLFTLISRLFIMGRWYILLRSAGVKISPANIVALTFSGLFASNFLPTTIGGDVVRLAGVMQMGYDRAVCLASIAADRLIGMFGMFLATPFGLIPAWNALGPGMFQASAMVGFFQKSWGFVKRTFQTFSIWAKQPLALLGSLGCTLGHTLFTFWALYVVIENLASHVPFWLVGGIYSLAYFVTLIPISINGYGLQEFSLTFLFSQIGGLSAGASLTVAVMIRAFYMAASLPGAAYLPSILVAINQSKQNRPNHETPADQ